MSGVWEGNRASCPIGDNFWGRYAAGCRCYLSREVHMHGYVEGREDVLGRQNKTGIKCVENPMTVF